MFHRDVVSLLRQKASTPIVEIRSAVVTTRAAVGTGATISIAMVSDDFGHLGVCVKVLEVSGVSRNQIDSTSSQCICIPQKR